MRIHCLADAPGEIRELVHVHQREFLAVFFHEKKPVAAPRNVAGHRADAGHVNRHGFLGAPAGDVRHGNFAARMQCGGDDADRGLDAVFARLDSAHVRQRDDEADGAMAAHAETADVVEENHTGHTRGVFRLDEQRPDHDVRTARLVDDGGPERVEFLLKALTPDGERSAAQIGAARHHDARRLAAGM